MEWIGPLIGFAVLGLLAALVFYVIATLYIRISKLFTRKHRPTPTPVAKSNATPLKRPSKSNTRQGAAFRWVPFGESVSVANAEIAGGGFYLGDHTRPHSPAVPLVDPALRVDFKQQEWSAELGYWPEYERLTPRQRGTLLAYLNSKRESTQVAIGYVFLYYYGLERRIFVDAFHDESLAGELPQLVAEVQRLHRVYGPLNHSFKQYSGRIATIGPLLYDSPVPLQPYDSFPWDMSEEMAATLGQAVKAGRGLTAEEAMLWASTLTNASKGKAYSKVLPEIRALFEARYREQYPAGLGVPLPKTKLKFDVMLSAPGYRSAEFATDLPDVRRVSAPLKPVVAMLEGV
ncbi:MAG: TerB N-terminal domain-containing protein, partial [Planctomycetales bacterium]|nr:TerB N-terminal domain-containing protein [Planctomycetales bacterium]